MLKFVFSYFTGVLLSFSLLPFNFSLTLLFIIQILIPSTIPAKRFAKPFEIANTVLFLCSDDASYINGQNLSIDGALTKGY